MAQDDKQNLTAAALQYDPRKDAAPRLTAKGRGEIAEKILELARRYDIPVRQDPNLVRILWKLDLDEQVPPELYKAVAEILAYVYSLNERLRDRQKFP
jgi:flagellar biosynthesis protein